MTHSDTQVVFACTILSEAILDRGVRVRKNPSLRIFNIINTEVLNTMNKAQLIESIAEACQLTKADTENVLNTCLETIKKAVKKGDDVTLIGFGTFTKSKRKARTGRNPQTGKEIKIPAMTVPKFRAGREFKNYVK